MVPETNSRFWQKSARKIRLRINSGFILQSFLPALAALALLSGLLLLLFRNLDLPTGPLWLGTAIATPILLTLSFFISRKQFYTLSDTFVLLDAKLLLHNRLTVAESGRGEWPSPRPLPSLFNWSWQRLTLPPLLAAVFLFTAGAIPIRHTNDQPPIIPEEPIAWQQVDSWIETLAEEEIFEKESLTQWKEQIEQLRQNPHDEWYRHNSLEAGDNLRDNLADSIREMHTKLDSAAFALSLARNSLNEIRSGLKPPSSQNWENALAAFDTGNLRLSPEMLARLREIDLSSITGISEAEISRLSEMMKNGLKACEHALSGEPCDGSGNSCAICAGGRPGTSDENATTDLTFSQSISEIKSGRSEFLSNPDLSRAALGEQIGISQTAPETDPDLPTGQLSAGNANTITQGGETVFHSRLTPAEEKQLQKYFR